MAPDIRGLTDLEEIGRGGFGVVYKAFQPMFERHVAVKVMQGRRLDEASQARFERECRAAGGAVSGHPNIVDVYDAGTTPDGEPFIVMDHLTGGTLVDRVKRDGTFAAEQVLRIGTDLAGALEAAHRAGIVHRDVKPENVLFSMYGHAQLADFGIARLANAYETKTGTVSATLAHAAPEVLSGAEATARSDVYSLGSVLYFALTGEAAFVRTTDETIVPLLARIAMEPLPDLHARGVAAPLAEVLERTMAKEPTARYASAADCGMALQEAARQMGMSPPTLITASAPTVAERAFETVQVQTPPPTPRDPPPPTPTPTPPPVAPLPPPAAKERRKRTPLLIGALVLVVALAAGGAFFARRAAATAMTPMFASSTTSEVTTRTTEPSTTMAPTSSTLPRTTLPQPPHRVALHNVGASAQAPNGIDANSSPISFHPRNVADGRLDTAWRAPGDGIGVTMRFDAPGHRITRVGLLPGYAKIDPTDGTDRFHENRRVVEVRWRFSDGSTMSQHFLDAPNIQFIDVDAPTGQVIFEIIATTPHGGRDFTAISEVEVWAR